MAWQDWVISIGQVIAGLALIPTIRGKEKPPLSTSLTTAVVIGTITFTFTTLHLWIAALTGGMICIGWSILAYQKYKQTKNNEPTGGN